ncbi:Mov34/MPN/PAD-1 family protein [Pseudomonadota bacterium]
MILLPSHLLDDINAQAVRSYPRESCGLLVGREDSAGTVSVSRIVPSENMVIGDGHDRFEIDPKVRFDLMRELDGGTETIIGHYHSHPDHPPQPSPTDIDMAFEPEFVWLITQVSATHAGNTRAWRLNRDERSSQEIELSDQA